MLEIKNLFRVLLILISSSCAAQITPLRDFNDYVGDTEGRYFKDLQNDLDPVVGTWVYTAQDTIITMELSIYQNYDYGEYSNDMIMGNYKVEIGGNVIYNTIDNPVTNPAGVDFQLGAIGVFSDTGVLTRLAAKLRYPGEQYYVWSYYIHHFPVPVGSQPEKLVWELRSRLLWDYDFPTGYTPTENVVPIHMEMVRQ